MSTVLKARIIKIGNSRGVRIPKTWLEQLNFREEVELVIESEQIVVRPAQPPRHGWEQHFRAMAAQGDDRLLDSLISTEWERDEWEW